MISQEELDLYRKHQGLFREKMGPLAYTDRLYHVFGEVEVIFWKISGTGHYVVFNKYGVAVALTEEDFNEQFIRLPLPIDPVNPARGLWGMVDWNHSPHA